MNRLFTFLFLFGLSICCSSQQWGTLLPSRQFVPKSDSIGNTTVVEICNNGLDDDGNGLTDLSDFSCFFDPANLSVCSGSNVIWGNTAYELHWYNVTTGVNQKVGEFPVAMGDITWASNGKLYGVSFSGGKIYEIDPYNPSNIILINSLPSNYYAGNGLTADGEGNLYVAALINQGQSHVIKINLTTWQHTVIANLYAFGVVSGGDLTFLNGSLYLGSNNSSIAKINVSTGNVEVFNLPGSPVGIIMGLVSIGDGNLYMAAFNRIYRIDPSTMTIDLVNYYSFTNNSISLWGLTSYSDLCQSPGCRKNVKISNLTSPPFCSSPGVPLTATGAGINNGLYKWYFPSGDSISGQMITATIPGIYKVRYYSTTDTCAALDTFSVNILPLPLANLGSDTIVCSGIPLILQPVNPANISSYSWDNGSVFSNKSVLQPGQYWLQVSNACGSNRDTIIVHQGVLPKLSLPDSISICSGSNYILKNSEQKTIWDKYQWWNNGSADSVMIQGAGQYWLKSVNACGVAIDTTIITMKDSCICFPFYPSVNLGPDQFICSYDSVEIKNHSHQAGFRYAWNLGGTNSKITVETKGLVWVDVTTYCGTVRDSILIENKIEGCEREIFVPNAFTPDGDGKNDFFKPILRGRIIHFEFLVFNRWGQIVFRSADPQKGWDGRFNGDHAPNEVFVWICNYQFPQQTKLQMKGTVILIR